MQIAINREVKKNHQEEIDEIVSLYKTRQDADLQELDSTLRENSKTINPLTVNIRNMLFKKYLQKLHPKTYDSDKHMNENLEDLRCENYDREKLESNP